MRLTKANFNYIVQGNIKKTFCENDIHKFVVMINDGYFYNKIDINSLLDYPSENNTCL